jgi:hypothetical protein
MLPNPSACIVAQIISCHAMEYGHRVGKREVISAMSKAIATPVCQTERPPHTPATLLAGAVRRRLEAV